MKFSRGSGVSALDWTGGPVAAHERVLRRIRGLGATPVQLRTAPVVRSSAVSTARPYTFTQQQPGASSITISRAPGGSGPSTASSQTTLRTANERPQVSLSPGSDEGASRASGGPVLRTARERPSMTITPRTTPTTETPTSTATPVADPLRVSPTPSGSGPFYTGGYVGGSSATPVSSITDAVPTVPETGVDSAAASTAPEAVEAPAETPPVGEVVGPAPIPEKEWRHRLVLTHVFIPAPFPVFSTSGYVFKVVK